MNKFILGIHAIIEITFLKTLTTHLSMVTSELVN